MDGRLLNDARSRRMTPESDNYLAINGDVLFNGFAASSFSAPLCGSIAAFSLDKLHVVLVKGLSVRPFVSIG
jgi:hypothetical protein